MVLTQIYCPHCHKFLGHKGKEILERAFSCPYCNKWIVLNRNEFLVPRDEDRAHGTEFSKEGFSSESKVGSTSLNRIFREYNGFGIILIVLFIVLGFLVVRIISENSIEAFNEDEIAKLKLQYDNQIKELKDANEEFLKNPELMNGILAKRTHEEEWKKRLLHDKEFASTEREKKILGFIHTNEDPHLTSKEIFKRVAVSSAPDGSNIDVVKEGDKYVIDVSFDMSAKTSGESGSSTKHVILSELKKETIEIICRVMKDLYENCGSRGIAKITVACRHGVQYENKSTGNVDNIVIYKCSVSNDQASKVSDWKSVPLYRVENMMKVEHDEFPRLHIKSKTEFSFY